MSAKQNSKSLRVILHNLFALYGLYGSGYLLALVTVPYLVRVLGPSNWGLVAFTQAFGSYLLLVVEFGFTLSATRSVSRNRDSIESRAEILAGVLGAKILLSFGAIGVAAVVQRFVPAFRDHGLLFRAGVFWALAQGCSLMWYFQGLERMRLAVGIDVWLKSLSVIAILLLVRSPRDDWKVLALQGVASFLSLMVLLGLAYRQVPFRLPGPRLAWHTLRDGAATFIPRNAMFLNNVGNTFVLGLFCPPHIVGFYAGADRIGRAIIGLLGPANDAFYPRINHIAKRSGMALLGLARLGMAVMTGIGMLMGIGIFVCAPQLVHILLGRGFEPAVAVLRIFALLAPLTAVINVLGMQWMLPLDLDRPFGMVVLGAAVSNLVLAVLLSPRLGGAGAAWAAVLSQAVVLSGSLLLLEKLRLNPLGGAGSLKALQNTSLAEGEKVPHWADVLALGRASGLLEGAESVPVEQQ